MEEADGVRISAVLSTDAEGTPWTYWTMHPVPRWYHEPLKFDPGPDMSLRATLGVVERIRLAA